MPPTTPKAAPPLLLLLLLLFAHAAGAQNSNNNNNNNNNNTDLIFPPPSSKDAALAEKLLLFIPGAHVATEYSTGPLEAIQEAANLRLWVVAPSIPGDMCINYCTSPEDCGGLEDLAAAAVAKAVAAGFGGSPTADGFVAGHSLGSECASSLAIASASAAAAAEPYAAAVLMGGFAPSSDVGAFPLPVLTLNAELDGGTARPGYVSLSLRSSDAWAVGQSQPLGGAWQLANGPVAILPGLDHSSFCPGYSVPGDVFPPEVSEATSDPLIGAATAAFLHLNTDQPGSVASDALAALQASVQWTRDLLAPLLAAVALEEVS